MQSGGPVTESADAWKPSRLRSQWESAGHTLSPRRARSLTRVHDRRIQKAASSVVLGTSVINITKPAPRPCGFIGDSAADANLSDDPGPEKSQVAVMLSEGRTVRDIASATGRLPGTVHDLTKNAYKRLGISRQVDLVRLVLQLSELSSSQD